MKVEIFGSLFMDVENFSAAARIEHNMIIDGYFLFHGTL